MNLHNIVGPIVAAVNPFTKATLQISTGYTTAADGTQVPAYAPAIAVTVQRQALQYNDLVQIQGLNIQGEKAAFYVSGNWQGVVRPDRKGGDILTLADGTVWLVVQVLENWSSTDGWAKVAAVRQLAP